MSNLSVWIEGLVRSWRIRVSLACALLLASGWAFFPHLAYRIAPVAFVNTELMRVTAPIPGRLASDLPRKGDTIDRAMTVSLIDTISPDRRHLVDLEQQTAVARIALSLRSISWTRLHLSIVSSRFGRTIIRQE